MKLELHTKGRFANFSEIRNISLPSTETSMNQPTSDKEETVGQLKEIRKNATCIMDMEKE